MDFSATYDQSDAPILIAGVDHIVLYMNAAAAAHYSGGTDLIGSSLLDCHEDEASNRAITAIVAEMLAGADERLTVDTSERRVFMVAVRDSEGSLLGYHERYEELVPRNGSAD